MIKDCEFHGARNVMTAKKRKTPYRAGNYQISLLLLLTILFIISCSWNIYENHMDTMERAKIEARTIFQHNLAYRRWNSLHGGVYARANEYNKPNEYLVTPYRDLDADGVKLTLINPFRMTRQAYDLLEQQSPKLNIINRTVSNVPLNPKNSPDPWEKAALGAFEQGQDEVTEITDIKGEPYMRLMKPYITEEGCLPCHGWQGYEVGDIRGGMSIAVPMQPYYASSANMARINIISHIFLWILGVGTILFFTNGLRKYQQAIFDSEEKFRIVSEFAHNFECWIQEPDKIVFISPSCKRITGYSREEFMDHPGLMTEIVHPDDREIQKNHLHTFTDAAHEEIEYRIITKDGEVRWLSHTCSPIFIDGKFLGRRGSNRDITEEKRLEQQLIQSQKLECLGQFAGGVAHDFNNTLSSISTFTNLIQDEIPPDTDKEVRDYLNYIRVATKLGKHLTDNLLAFGKKQINNPQPVKMNSVIHNIADIIKSLLSEDIQLRMNLTASEVEVMLDPHQLEQILINLCTNARDAMQKGGVIEISTENETLTETLHTLRGVIPPGQYMVLKIKDTGCGIDQDLLKSIFEPFYSTKPSNKGTGLGLSIINQIIVLHEGYIDVETQKDKGTTFIIYLPASVRQLVPMDKASTSEGGEESILRENTLLLVEDDELIRRSLHTFLKNKGMRVVLAENGEEAIEKYIAFKDLIDVILLDVVLPKKNGREVYNFITKLDPDSRIVFMSGYTGDILDEMGIKAVGMNFIEKPVDTDDLIMKLAHALEKKRAA